MKNLFIKAFLILFTVNLSYSQEWMTSLDIAQKLALVQNKMILMVWEETTEYSYPVLVKDDSGRMILIELFEDEDISPLIWKNFVPVIVNESQYADLYLEIKGKRKQKYIDKFNDDSIKIMDVNGNILNTSGTSEDFFQNITKLIETYSLNTKFIAPELMGYKNEKKFYSAYYLASKYLDFALYTNKNIRPEVIRLSNIYLDEAIALLETHAEKDKLILKQRAELLKIQEYLILKRPKKALRALKKMDAESIENNNKALIAFIYYTAYSILEDEKNTEKWKAKVSLVNLKKAEMIINLNS